jgi:3-keto-5-aminohexanoate cleavage enzyme
MIQEELLKKFDRLNIPPPIRWPKGLTQTFLSDKFMDFRNMPKWDIPETIVISVASSGTFIDKDQNPHQPMTADEIRKSYMEGIEAGAVSIHLHVRDMQGRATADLKVYHSVIDPIREKYGKNVVIDGGAMTGNSFRETIGPISEGLFDLAIVNPTTGLVGDRLRAMHPSTIQAQAEYYQACNVKPIIDIHDTACIDNTKKYLIDTGVLRKPYVWHLLLGLPGSFYMPNAMAVVEGLIYMVRRIREIDENSIILVSDPGRASIYMANFAILLGLHIRVGMEDSIWKYPHKDDKIESCREVVESVVSISQNLGRSPATALEFRKMVGLE